ncbi:MAG: hypothetical protein KAS26_00845, partial [Sulfurimonas sp.]|nr:hypothetical protein [Sulfurimonas sp.]
VKGKSEAKSSKMPEDKLYNIKAVSLTELMTLQGMEEDVAVNIKELVAEKEITSFEKLAEYFTASKEQIKQWSKFFIK